MIAFPTQSLRFHSISSVTVMFLIFLTCVLMPFETQAATSNKEFIGYFPQWGIYDRNFHVRNLEISGAADQLTIINYAFAHIVGGECVMVTQSGVMDAYADYQRTYSAAESVDGVADTSGQPLRGNFNQLKKLKQLHPGLKVLIAIGGWTWSEGFSDAALSVASRQNAVASCIDIYIHGNLPMEGNAGGIGAAAGVFDGISVDWEYVAAPANAGHVYRPEDTQNYTLLLEEFRSQLDAIDPKLILTAAAPSGPHNYNLIELNQIHNHLDYIELMTYDMHGSWESTTNFHSPLYSAPGDPSSPQLNADKTIQDYLAAGVPAEKLIMGIPYYGHGWNGVVNSNNGLYQSASGPAPGTYEAGIADYKVLKNFGYPNFRDDDSKAYWIYNGDQFWSFDDVTVIAEKTGYIRQQGLAGAMVWSLYGDDANATLTHAIGSGLQSQGPVLAGCPSLPSDSIWNTPIDSLPVDDNSVSYIQTIGPDISLHPDFGAGYWPPDSDSPIGIPWISVSGNQPKLPVDFTYASESDPGPYPIPDNPPIEGGPNGAGDRHILMVDEDNCILYELFNAWPPAQQGDNWQAGSGAIFDLNSNALRPETWTSADAAGLPILPGLVRYDEVASGAIHHAIRFTVPQTRRDYVWPARHFASSLTGPEFPPMGQRFRLRSDFDITGFSTEVQVILQAMKTYGIILADNGSAWFISGEPDDRWDNDALVNELKQVKGSDFEAVDVSSLMVDIDSGQAAAPQPPTSNYTYSDSDIFTYGSVSGTHTDTHSDNGVVQSITEKQSGGKPKNRYSRLQHGWTFQVPPGSLITLEANTYSSGSTDNDTFAFFYSRNGNQYFPMFNVSSTDPSNTEQFTLPDDLSGTVYIRVEDTDHTQGNKALDTIIIDYLAIRSETAEGDPPLQPTGLTAAASGSTAIDLVWDDNDDESGYTLERSLDQNSWSTIASLTTNTTSHTDNGLSPATLYFYRLLAYNPAGDSGYSSTASASTDPAPETETLHVSGLASSSQSGRNNWTATAIVSVADQNNATVQGATVTGNWSNGISGSGSCITDPSGQCEISKTVKKRISQVRFSIVDLQHSQYDYEPLDNTATEIDIFH